MPTAIFSFHLRPGADPDELARRLHGGSAPTALAEATVERWTVSRVVDWPGTSDPAPDFVAIVEISDLDRWSADGAAAITANEAALEDLVREIGMIVLEPVDG